jgi:hypothetical protein
VALLFSAIGGFARLSSGIEEKHGDLSLFYLDFEIERYYLHPRVAGLEGKRPSLAIHITQHLRPLTSYPLDIVDLPITQDESTTLSPELDFNRMRSQFIFDNIGLNVIDVEHDDISGGNLFPCYFIKMRLTHH